VFIPLHDANPLRHVAFPYVTWGLIGITIAVHAAIWLAAQTTLIPNAETGATVAFGVIPSVVEGIRRMPAIYDLVPPPVTLVSYAFLHADMWHLAGNMVFLWVFGDNVEDAFGHLKFLAFYLVSAAVAGGAHVLLNPTSDLPLIGASGAIAAIVSAYLILHPRVRLWILALGRIPLPIPAWLALGAWILFQFYNVAVHQGDNVAWWAHIGGLAAGAALVLVLRRPGVRLFDTGTDLGAAA